MSYCIQCGSRLDDGHRFCPQCGTARYSPPADRGSTPPKTPPPLPRRQPAQTATTGAAASEVRPKVPEQVTVIAVLSAATSIAFLVLLTQMAALIANPHGRDNINLTLVRDGVAASQRPGLLIVSEILGLLFLLIPALLHGLAFYGLMALRRGGWVLAFLLSLAWCVVLVGFPFAFMLWRRDTRAAFGFFS